MQSENTKLLTIREVCSILRLGRTAFWRLAKEDNFPSPVQISRNRKAYLLVEIEDWITSLAAARPKVKA